MLMSSDAFSLSKGRGRETSNLVGVHIVVIKKKIVIE